MSILSQDEIDIEIEALQARINEQQKLIEGYKKQVDLLKDALVIYRLKQS